MAGDSTLRPATPATDPTSVGLGADWSTAILGQRTEPDANPAAVHELEPANASQHARLYPPAGALPAVVIATPYIAGSACRIDVDGQPVQGLGWPRVKPLGAAGFPCGWTLDDAALRELRALNLPGF